jgi:ATP-dependent exoDNAse (exonuclease V) beta subunit
MTELERMWSVTTLIGAGLPKPALVGWAANVTAEYAVDKREVWQPLAEDDREAAIKHLAGIRYQSSGKAMARGTDVHKAAERLNLGLPPDHEPHLQPYVDQYLQFLADHSPTILMAEAPVYSQTYHYAGTLDLILELEDRICVTDIKTTDRGKDSPKRRPPYPDIALQLCAYARAETVGIAPAQQRYSGRRRYYVLPPDAPLEPMPEVSGGLALVISPDDYQLVPVRIDDEIWNAFLAVREVARFQLDTANRVLGPAISPGGNS